MVYYVKFKGILEWVMDSKQKDQQQIQERVLMLQKEKEQVSHTIAFTIICYDII